MAGAASEEQARWVTEEVKSHRRASRALVGTEENVWTSEIGCEYRRVGSERKLSLGAF